jgi:hypothetical protein
VPNIWLAALDVAALAAMGARVHAFRPIPMRIQMQTVHVDL